MTGATGFIGGHLVRALLDHGFAVRALVRDERKAAGLAEQGVELVRGDIGDRSTLTGIGDGVDYVFHTAAKLNRNQPTKPNDDSYLRDNVEGVANVVDALRGTSIKKFVHVSSLAAIGIRPLGMIDEQVQEAPDLAYGKAKLEADRLLLRAHREERLPVVILRPPTVYGPGERYNFLALCRAIKSRRFVHIGRGTNRIDFCWVGNLVHGMLRAAEVGRAGEMYLLSDDPPLPFRETVDQLSRLLLGKPGSRLFLPVQLAYGVAYPLDFIGRKLDRPMPLYPTRVRTMSGDLCFDIGKAKRELGYAPTGPFLEHARTTVDWYRQMGLL